MWIAALFWGTLFFPVLYDLITYDDTVRRVPMDVFELKEVSFEKIMPNVQYHTDGIDLLDIYGSIETWETVDGVRTRILGYKYYILGVAEDKDGKSFFVSYGPVESDKKIESFDELGLPSYTVSGTIEFELLENIKGDIDPLERSYLEGEDVRIYTNLLGIYQNYIGEYKEMFDTESVDLNFRSYTGPLFTEIGNTKSKPVALSIVLGVIFILSIIPLLYVYNVFDKITVKSKRTQGMHKTGASDTNSQSAAPKIVGTVYQGKVLVYCPGCSQGLRLPYVPGSHGVCCPKCSTYFECIV